ncbi:MAG: ParB/RepB/Spo0J family partition protein, partial [Bacilli bacterium]|nr:ParB/RepB/Spo0J family partition protein [Bacilli bacterium]
MEIAQKQVIELPIDSILPNRFQPRIKYDENQIYELSESIKTHGVIQPILVRQLGDKYEIVAGERRYKASLLAGKQTIPAVIRNMSDKDSMEIALAENVQRVDLTPIEEAISYKKVLDKGEMTQDELARKLGKNQSTIANKIRLLNLDEEVQEALLENKISERHARSLLKLKSRKDQVDMLNKIIIERLTVRKLDEEIEKIINKKEVPNEVIIDNYEVSDEVLDIPTMPVIIDEEIEGENMNNNINQDTNAQLAQNTMLNSTVINSDETNTFIENTKVQDPYENIDTILNNAQQINVEKPLNDINKLLTPDEITKEEVEQPKFKEGKFFNIPNNIEVEEKE